MSVLKPTHETTRTRVADEVTTKSDDQPLSFLLRLHCARRRRFGCIPSRHHQHVRRRMCPLDLGQCVHAQRRPNLLLSAVPTKPKRPLNTLLQPISAILERLQLSANLRFCEMQVRQTQRSERADEQAERLQCVTWAGVNPVEAFVGTQTEADAVGADGGGDGLDDAGGEADTVLAKVPGPLGPYLALGIPDLWYGLSPRIRAGQTVAP